MDKDPHIVSWEDNMSSLSSVGLSGLLDKNLDSPTLVITNILWCNRPYSVSPVGLINLTRNLKFTLLQHL